MAAPFLRFMTSVARGMTFALHACLGFRQDSSLMAPLLLSCGDASIQNKGEPGSYGVESHPKAIRNS